MLRIFGFYSFSKPEVKIIKKSKEIFEIPSEFTKFTEFRFGNIYLNYESTNSKKATNFYFITPNKELACFIIGNIHAYEKATLKILPQKNLARTILTKYKENNLDFVKYLRGIFNIIIIDKNRLFLINDKLGLSPMYTYKTSNELLFCNEVEPIVWFNNKNYIDYSSIAEFLIYGFVPNGKTFFYNLHNQHSATIIEANKQKISEQEYTTLSPINFKGLDDNEKLQLTKDTFSEAIRIRLNKGHIFSELTGGWDTRFVLANLLELNANVIPFTANREKEDLIIAKKIANTKNLDQIILNSTIIPSSLKNNYTFKFKPRKTIYDNINNANIFNKDINYLKNMNFFTSPRFTGLVGADYLGYTSLSFIPNINQNLNFDLALSRIFLRNFLFKAYDGSQKKELIKLTSIIKSQNPILLFSNQILRSYICSHHADSWERPTFFFNYLFLNPFIDSKFVILLHSLKCHKYMNYKLYNKIYKKFFSSFLEFPWTDKIGRIKNNLDKKNSKKPKLNLKKDNTLLQLVASNNKFRNFLKKNKIIQKNNLAISSRLKELYFVFYWLDTYKSVLPDSQIKSLIEIN